jgi:hypothetical protein
VGIVAKAETIARCNLSISMAHLIGNIQELGGLDAA